VYKREDEENCMLRSFIICSLHNYYFGDEIKKDEMGRACCMHGSYAKCVQNFNRKKSREERLGDISASGGIIVK
jgi:hypothetical protein